MTELRTHRASPMITWLYQCCGGNRRRSVAKAVFGLLFRLEGGQYRSASVRRLLARDYAVEVGAHSYGECFVPGAFAPSVRIGKFVSIAKDVRVLTQNHPIDRISTHPYYYEMKFGIVEQDQLVPACTEIGHDVWIGQGAVLLPGCKRVGTGAIIGAGSVVTKDVPDYAIVAGNPARLLRYRFSQPQIQQLLESKWWDRTTAEHAMLSRQFCTPVTELPADSAILQPPQPPG